MTNKLVRWLLTEHSILEEKAKSQFQHLKDNKKDLDPEELAQVKADKAVWSDGRSAIWKSVHPKTGKVTYVTHTHRSYQATPTLKGTIAKFHSFIKDTA